MWRPDGLPHAIAWDLDGTLVDSAPDLAEVLNTMLGERGLSGLSLRKVRTMVGDGVQQLIERGFSASGTALSPEETAAMVPRFLDIYSGAATVRTRPFPFVREMLAYLSDAGVSQGVCTNKPEAVSRTIIEDLGLAGFFGNVTGGDTTLAKKPDARPLAACLEALGTKPKDSVMIGDSSVNVRTARALGLPVGLVAWGYTNVPARQLGADFVINDLTDLPRLIQTAQR